MPSLTPERHAVIAECHIRALSINEKRCSRGPHRLWGNVFPAASPSKEQNDLFRYTPCPIQIISRLPSPSRPNWNPSAPIGSLSCYECGLDQDRCKLLLLHDYHQPRRKELPRPRRPFSESKNVLPPIPCCGHCMSGSPMMQETVDSTMESPTITAVGDNGTMNDHPPQHFRYQTLEGFSFASTRENRNPRRGRRNLLQFGGMNSCSYHEGMLVPRTPISLTVGSSRHCFTTPTGHHGRIF